MRLLTPRRLLLWVATSLAGLGCAPTSPDLPPAEEVLLVVDSTEASLRVIPVNSPSSLARIALGGTSPTPVGVSARNEIALVPMGLDNSVAVVNLRTANVTLIPLPANSGATGSAVIDDSIGYVANPNLNSITRVNYLTGDTASVAVGAYPQGMIFARGKLFVLNGNLVACPPPDVLCPGGPSWLTVIDPAQNAKAQGIDSVFLQDSTGNAQFAAFSVVGGQGLLFVMNSGSRSSGHGTLSIIDPVDRKWKSTVSGFGTGPGNLALGGDTLYISSLTQGVLAFDTRTGLVVRGAGNGVLIPANVGVAVDSKGRIYALETGPCNGGAPGKAHVLLPDLTETSPIPLGDCPRGSAVTSIPPL